MELGGQLNDINVLLRQFKNGEAFERSQSFIFGATIVRDYAQQEIDAAEIRLQCCQIHHTPPSNILYYSILALSLSIIAICAPLFVLVGYMFYRKVNSPGKPKRRPVAPKKKDILPTTL
mmetsp:Transcript_59220/g.89360  ORF Transcript_59220/g.89360 Transcript_59220/m.89360 type:complete len:119 (+) Transcript_59220:416-772(+)